MMPRFSSDSLRKLQQCDPELQRLFLAVIPHFDCCILTGHRSQPEQDQAFAEGRSQKRWPKSKHNGFPSTAIDVAPYPIDWKDRDRFHYFAGFVMGTAKALGLHIRWGGDWNGDTRTADNVFDDLVHFELVRSRPESEADG